MYIYYTAHFLIELERSASVLVIVFCMCLMIIRCALYIASITHVRISIDNTRKLRVLCTNIWINIMLGHFCGLVLRGEVQIALQQPELVNFTPFRHHYARKKSKKALM